MSGTLLSIAQSVAKRLMWVTPSTVIGNTDNNIVLLLSIIEQTIDEIGNSFDWPELRKQHLFPLIGGLGNYPLPPDFDHAMDETQWNRGQQWPLIGPIGPELWQQIESGLITTLPRQRFRVMGNDLNQFFINPTPTSDNAGQLAVYEYISKRKRRPKTWVKNTAYTSGSSYVWSNGLILLCSTSGTSNNADSRFPQTGLDNTTYWESCPAFVASGNYYEGQYISANSKVYLCTVTGKASATAPSHTSGSATNGTCTFEWKATPSTWGGGLDAVADETYIANSLGDLYRCTVSGQTGQYEPVFREVLGATGFGQPPTYSTTTITDGTAVWTVQTSGYPTFLADTDISILDDQAIVDGAIWRILEDRGFDYAEKKRMAEDELEIIKGKIIGGATISYNTDQRIPWMVGVWSYPQQGFSG